MPSALRVERQGDTRRVLLLALPAVGEQILNMTVGLVDTYMVGHLGASSVAATGLALQGIMLVTTFFTALATGVTALVARHRGAGETEQASHVTAQGYLVSGITAGLLTLISITASLPIMRLLQAPPDVVQPGANVLAVNSTTFILTAWLFVGNAALRGAGDTRTTMKVMALVNVVNLVVAYLFIYGPGPFPELGVTGSAIGAAAGRGAGGLWVTALLLRGRFGLRLRPRRMRPNFGQIRRILNIGVPAGLEQLAMRGAQTVFAVTVAGLGTQAYAAHQLALQGESLSFMPGFGFAVAATTLVGQGLGAGDPQRARADARLAQRLALLSMSLMGVLFFIFAAQILDIFIDDPGVVQAGIWPLRLVAFSQPALATLMVLSGGLRGAGDTRATLMITTGGMWVIRIPLTLLLVPTLGLIGAWIAMGIDLNLRSFAMYRRFSSDHWTHLRV